MFTCRNVIPVSAMHHCATLDKEHHSTCWCWMWPPQPMCWQKCKVPCPVRLPQEISILCWPNCILNDARNLWLPATIICKASNGSYLVQVISGGQYRHVHDHIWEHHPHAVKPDTSNIGKIAPAAFTSTHATQAVRPPTAVAPTTPTPAAPAATLQTPCKALPAVHSAWQTQTPSTGTPLSQTGTVPAVLHWSTQSRKPPFRCLEET